MARAGITCLSQSKSTRSGRCAAWSCSARRLAASVVFTNTASELLRSCRERDKGVRAGGLRGLGAGAGVGSGESPWRLLTAPV
jgi:hypothetical protein